MVINSLFKHNFSLHRYFIWNNRNILYKHKSLFLRTGLTTILNCLVSYKTRRNTLMSSFLFVKYQFLKESSQLFIGSVPSGTHMLGIDKTILPIQHLLMLLMFFFTLVKCVFHEVIIKLFVLFFSKRNCYCTLCFVSLELFMKWKIDLLEKSVVVTAEISL